MGFIDFMRDADVNQGVAEYPSARLLDVRTPQKYREGYIPNSVNLPLQKPDGESPVPARKDTPLFVYCHSGAHSRHAVSLLERMGYAHAKNIGGIAAYKGRVAL